MRHYTKIAHVVVAAILMMCTTGSAMAEKGGLRGEVTKLEAAVAAVDDQVQLIQFNQDNNIVKYAAYVANGQFDQYFVQLNRTSEGCRAFVADKQVLSAFPGGNPETFLMDPDDLLALAGVPQFFNQVAMIPIHVECLGDEGLVNGDVTGLLYPDQALPNGDFN